MGIANEANTTTMAPEEIRGKRRSCLSWLRTPALAFTSAQLREKRANMTASFATGRRLLCSSRDFLAQLAKLRLHLRRVGRSHANEHLLSRGEPLELGIGVLVKHVAHDELDRAVRLGRGEQVIDHLHEAIVEM